MGSKSFKYTFKQKGIVHDLSGTHGIYLLTGGMGGIGFTLALYLKRIKQNWYSSADHRYVNALHGMNCVMRTGKS
ncbi:hypothetical protein ACEQPO_04965 [Bacillus sp. SL00103]